MMTHCFKGSQGQDKTADSCFGGQISDSADLKAAGRILGNFMCSGGMPRPS